MADEVRMKMSRQRPGRSRRLGLHAGRRFLLPVLLAMATCAGCTDRKSPPPPPRGDLRPVVDWLDRHYRKTPPGKGWKISSVVSQGAQVQVTVAIPGDQASGIMRQPAEDQFRLVAEQVCPARTEDVWQLLPAGSSVKVLPSVSGQVFIEVDCGH
jgi:hypothetical protein